MAGAWVNLLRLAVWLVVLTAVFTPLERMLSGQTATKRENRATDVVLYFLNNVLPQLLLSIPLGLLAWVAQRCLSQGWMEGVAALPVGDDGKLSAAASQMQHAGSSVNPDRQKEPHAHSINVSPDNRFAVAADLGLDKLLVYKFDAATSTLTPNDPPSASVAPGSGPRHAAFHPNGKLLYAINEILCTLTTFAYDAERGLLTELQTLSTLPSADPLKPGYSTAEVQVHPSGKFVYGSNRGHDSITVFAVDPEKGTLSYVDNHATRGKTPRGFGIDPTGNFFLAGNQDSGTIAVFRIDQKTGRLAPIGDLLEVGSPVCVKFVMP